MTEQTKQTNNNWKHMYNIYATLITAFVSAISGFGMFWFCQLSIFYNVFFNIFIGMIFSALMFNIVKLAYPLKK